MKKLILTIVVLLLLVVSLAVVGYKENSRRNNIIVPEPETKEEEKEEEQKVVIVKEEIRSDKSIENLIKSGNTRYINDASKYIKDIKLISENYNEYNKGDLRIEGNKIVFDYEYTEIEEEDEEETPETKEVPTSPETSITTEEVEGVPVTRYIMDYFEDIKTIVWNKTPNEKNEIILYVVNSYTMAEYPNVGDGLHKIVINVKDKTINKYTFYKLSYSNISIASINCLESNCPTDNFYVLASPTATLTSYAYTDYKFGDEDNYSLIASSNLESDLSTQVVTTTTNTHNHTIKLTLEKKLNVEFKDSEEHTYKSNIIEYKLFIDDKEVNSATDYYKTSEYLNDFVIKLESDNIKNTKGLDNKEYIVVKLHLPNDSQGVDNIHVINENGKLLATLKYDLNAGIGSIKGRDANSYKVDNKNALVCSNCGNYSSYAITNQFFKFIRPIDEDSNESDYEEKAIVISNDKATLKSTGEEYTVRYMSEASVPKISIKTY